MSMLWEPIAPPKNSRCKCACALTRPWFLVVILSGEMITFQSVCLRYVKELQRAQRQALPECKQKIPRSKYTDREWKTQRIFGFSPASFCISALELFDNQKVSRKTSTKVQWNLVISVFFFHFPPISRNLFGIFRINEALERLDSMRSGALASMASATLGRMESELSGVAESEASEEPAEKLNAEGFWVPGTSRSQAKGDWNAQKSSANSEFLNISEL